MNSILNIFNNLNDEVLSGEGSYHITSIPTIEGHRLGKNSKGHPMFFINCIEEPRPAAIDSSLELITVLFNKNCELMLNGSINTGNYTIIMLNSISPDLKEYFLDIMFLLISKLPERPSLQNLKTEVEKIINLFNKISKPATKSIQGLWAELLSIELSSDPSYLIESWHKDKSDKFDFNDGFDKVEIKSTAKEKRVHRFSIGQLSANDSAKLVVVSICVVPTGKGKSVFDLVRLIEKKVNMELTWKLNEIVTETLGNDFEKAFEIYFDFNYALDSILYFDGKDIPTINASAIPKEISNIQFDCDLTSVEPLHKIIYNSTLHKALLP